MITLVTRDPEEYLADRAAQMRRLGCSEEYVAEAIKKIRDEGIEQVRNSYEANLKRAGKTL